MLSLLTKNKPTLNQVVKEICQAIRILQSKNKATVLVINKSEFSNKVASAQEIISKSNNCYQGVVEINFQSVKTVNCLLPFPEKVFQKELTDLELGCLGYSQNSEAVIISIVKSGQITIYHNNSIKKLDSVTKLSSILKTVFFVYSD